MPSRLVFLVLLGFFFTPITFAQSVIVSDEGVGITREEFEAVLASLPEKIRLRAANDVGDRFELLTQLISARKLASLADTMEEDDGDYWELQFELLQKKEKYMFNKLVKDEIKEPDFEPLARERYETEKDK
ncbi:MAG: hypothetical protein ABR578_09985, partial [Chromatocurvus sp.]